MRNLHDIPKEKTSHMVRFSAVLDNYTEILGETTLRFQNILDASTTTFNFVTDPNWQLDWQAFGERQRTWEVNYNWDIN